MTNDEFLCVRCARHMKTCCQTSEIYTTPADVERITAASGRDDFTEFRVPADVRYLDQDDDPVWRDRVFRDDDTRRVLKRRPDGDCTFLGDKGCTLALEIRPLVCRLYPYEYTETEITDDLSSGCPLELLRPDQDLIGALEMNPDDARRWHRQLYDEIQLEPAN